METLGPKNVLDYAKRFGFEQDFPPYLPIALGAGDGTLLEVTSAYTVFPNQGVRMKPFEILQGAGSRRQSARGEPRRADRRDPRRHGVRDDQPAARRRAARHRARRPAWRASTGRSPARPAPSTTTPTPGSSASIRTSRSASGSASTRRSRSAATRQGAVAALPIWMEFMKAYIDGRPDKEQPAEVRGARQHRVSRGGQVHRRRPAAGHRRMASTRRSSPARSPARLMPTPHRARPRRVRDSRKRRAVSPTSEAHQAVKPPTPREPSASAIAKNTSPYDREHDRHDDRVQRRQRQLDRPRRAARDRRRRPELAYVRAGRPVRPMRAFSVRRSSSISTQPAIRPRPSAPPRPTWPERRATAAAESRTGSRARSPSATRTSAYRSGVRVSRSA